MREAYIQRDNPAFEAQLENRTAAAEAAFFLPHLRPGMQLLDVGCGPGAITLGLAESLFTGQVVGVDLQPAMVERARELAGARGLAHVRFEAADIYQLPFPDGSFDAAFAHMVLMHLREPERGLREIRRVLRPGGVLGLRDPDLASTVRWPSTPEWERFLELRLRAHEWQGSDGRIARKHRQLLLMAGFERTEGRAHTFGAGSEAATRSRASFLRTQLVGTGRTALAEGWVDQAAIDAMAADIDAWAERDDAFFFTVVCETLGWVRA